MAAIGADYGVAIYAGALNESDLGMAASAHAFSGLPGVVEGCDFYFPSTVLDDIGIHHHDGGAAGGPKSTGRRNLAGGSRAGRCDHRPVPRGRGGPGGNVGGSG